MAISPKGPDSPATEYPSLLGKSVLADAAESQFVADCLRPVLHYRIGHLIFEQQAYRAYQEANDRTAAEVLGHLRPGDLVCIRGLAFLPLASSLRRAGWDGMTGYFLDAPFPAPEVFAAIPRHRELALGLAANDLIGFQTRTYRDNFTSYLSRYAGVDIEPDGTFRHAGRVISTAVCALGINVDMTSSEARECRPARRPEDAARMIVSFDLFDKSAALPERLQAFAKLLGDVPSHRGHVRLLQAAVADGREGSQLRDKVHRLVGDINGRFGTVDWTPVCFVNRPVPRTIRLDYLRRADVGLVAPHRESSSLTAHEFVAAQRPHNPGVLVLSRLSGSAEQLDAALLVNPGDTEAMAEAMHRALVMSLPDRQARHQRLLDSVRATSRGAWQTGFLGLLKALDKDETTPVLDQHIAGAV